MDAAAPPEMETDQRGRTQVDAPGFSRRGALLFGVVLAITSVGCPPKPPPDLTCQSNLNCPTGHHCDANGYCTFDCRRDSDCSGGRCSSLGKCIQGVKDGAVVDQEKLHDVPQDPWPLDLPTGGDGPPPLDTHSSPDSSPKCSPFSGGMGKLCNAHKDCPPTHFCLGIAPTTKICTKSCTPDDPSTPSVDEDDCPGKPKVRCARIPGAGLNVIKACLRVCTPFSGCNECAPGVACGSGAGAVVGLWGEAVCLYPGCTKNSDCVVSTGQKCSTALNNCPAGQICKSLATKSTPGICVRPGVCDTVSGLCTTHSLGNPSAKVGDPCKGDIDCGGNMTCYLEQDWSKLYKPEGESCSVYLECCSLLCTGGKCGPGVCSVKNRNGYCGITGCRFGSTLKHRTCPVGSHCNLSFSQGICQKACNLTKASDCRGYPKDQFGDYECRAWNRVKFSYNPGMASKGPVCDFGYRVPCNLSGSSSSICSLVGTSTNYTNMACRDLKNNLLSSSTDPLGFCFDDTASGPVVLTQDAGIKPKDSSTLPQDGGPSTKDAAPPNDGGPLPVNNKCTSPTVLIFNASGEATASGSTTAATNEIALPASGCTGYASKGRDVFFAVTLSAGKCYTVSLKPSAKFDPMIYVFTGCAAAKATCLAGKDTIGSGKPEILSLAPVKTGSYYIAVDSWDDTDFGTFNLKVSLSKAGDGGSPGG